ncbi:imidazolonepropionase [Polyangium spumosum]|uniref:Imidazolonepropionase n=1 Tax=Polyangium spumosum TaxID=889282 RepID=A0A6N7Q2N1_9BACT|nr:imidazolonepropionase [Polyangium spumosum]MRG97957.1 imidazolonepropionase [Polyangium spumosum]
MRSFLLLARRIVTCDPARATEADPLGVIEDGAIAVEGGAIVDVGPREEVLARRGGLALVSGEPAPLVTPGLVDAHTHAPWVGSRDAEYALRLAGAGYEAIAAAGGGIVSSMRAVREASPDEIDATLSARLRRMASLGVTTVEAKSGYGLDEAGETKQLEALERASARRDLPRVVPTFLALHAIPPEARADRAAYIEAVRERTLPAIAARRLARFVDVYVDRAAFSVDEARPVLARAASLGLGVRVHAGQFADVGGAELAAELGAASADHLEQVSPEGARALARAGVRAVLLPVACFTLRQDPPPVAVLRAAGVRLVVASDANPGTAPTESLPLALALAVRMYGLTVPEVILGATREAAASLGLGDEVGVVRPGTRADLVAWDLPHENALVQPWGVSRARVVLRDGAPIAGDLA